MTAGTAFSYALLILGTNVFWMFVLWLCVGHYAKTTRFLLEENRELSRCTWATRTTIATGNGSPGVLANAAAQSAGVADSEPDPENADGRPFLDESRLMGLG